MSVITVVEGVNAWSGWIDRWEGSGERRDENTLRMLSSVMCVLRVSVVALRRWDFVFVKAEA